MPIQLPYVVDYTVQVDVNAPPDIVLRTVADPHRYGVWQPEFHGATIVAGRPGEPGLVCRLRFGEDDGAEIEMTEEVLELDHPHREVTCYTWGPVRNTVDNRFTALPDGHTRWAAHHIFEIDDVELATLAKDHPTMFRDASREAMHALASYFASRRTGGGATAMSAMGGDPAALAARSAQGGPSPVSTLPEDGPSVEDLEEIERRQLESS